MKKILLITLLAVSVFTEAQTKHKLLQGHLQNTNQKQATTAVPANPLYTFSTFTAPYVPITGTLVSGGLQWDDSSFPVPLGFNFRIYNDLGNTINFAEGSYATFNNPNSSIITLATPMFEDLCDRAWSASSSSEGDPGGVSDISYSFSGIAGSRICMIQVKNAGLFGEIAVYDTSESYVNFQLWLYEGTNDMEFHFGDVKIENASDNLLNPAGFLCGLAEQVNVNTGACISSNVLNGPASGPAMTGLGSTLSEVVTGTVQSGRVYKFSRVNPNPVGLNVNASIEQLSFYPNPASRKVFCNVDLQNTQDGRIRLYSLDGRLIAEKKLVQEIDLSGISNGVYLIKALSNTGDYLYSGKLVIAN